MKKRMAMIALAVICLAVGILLGNAWVGMRSSSVYTSIRNEDNYLLEFHPLNMEHTETYQMTEGSSIQVDIVRAAGWLDVSIGQEGKKAIYTANNAESASFTVLVPETGAYVLTVSGRQAEGSVKFTLLAGTEI